MDVEPASHQTIAFEELDEWCHIAYYEMAQRIGGQYDASRSQVIVDGFMQPSSADRFCLGHLTNIQRTPDIDRVRLRIGHGVKFYQVHGNVFAECLSESPVYVQSPIANRMKNWHPATVCKIPSRTLPRSARSCATTDRFHSLGDRFQIFDSQNFAEVLECAIQEGYAAVYNLTKICTIRMSFVKGWGVDYERSTVTSTPCWIEIHLDGPLKWIDRVISILPGPIESTTSAS